MNEQKLPFFVGYLPVPQSLKPFLIIVAVVAVAGAGSLGIVIGATQDDPGPGAFRYDYGTQRLTGVVERTPLPILHVTRGTDQVPAGRTIMLSNPGKNGAQNREPARTGQLVDVAGIILKRGDINMLQLRGGGNGMRAADGAAEVPMRVDLGWWKLAGEICDGKCLAGAMRPGRGLAHKACANLCIIGGVPPVFVSTRPVEGSAFLMIAGPGQSDMPSDLYNYVAQYISVEGQVTRHGDLLVFSVDPATIEVLP
ncbi:MAG: hypothetical protein GDA36_04100 [Rhodobacteraceae bacterium]|nr:hypothetical protein [Paracoccaceae bacterium]